MRQDSVCERGFRINQSFAALRLQATFSYRSERGPRLSGLAMRIALIKIGGLAGCVVATATVHALRTGENDGDDV